MKHIFIGIFILLMPQLTLNAQQQEQAYGKWRIGISGGAGYMLGSTKETVNALVGRGIDRHKAKKGIDDLKTLLQLGSDVHYLIKPNWGIGIKYSYSHTNFSIDDISLNVNGDGITANLGDIKTDYFLNYIGPSFIAQYFIGNSNRLALSGIFSAGYSHLRMEELVIVSPVIATGSSLGLLTTFGISYFLTKRLSLGCDMGLFASSFGKMTFKDRYRSVEVKFDDNQRENVSNINLSFNLRLHI